MNKIRTLVTRICTLSDDECMIIAIGIAIFAYGFITDYLITM